MRERKPGGASHEAGGHGDRNTYLGTKDRITGPPQFIATVHQIKCLPQGVRKMTSRPAIRNHLKSSRRELQGKITPIFVADEPRGRLRLEEEGFPQRFPSSRRGFRSFTPFCTHTHRRWGSIGGRGVAAGRDRRKGRSYVILRCQPRGYEYGYGKPYERASFGLGKPSLMPSAPAGP